MQKTYSRAYVEITNICNMNCSFCHGHSRAPRKMSYEEFDKLTNDLMGVTQYLYYHLMGEPLTHPELCDFIKLANSKGFKSAVTTNGTLLDKKVDVLTKYADIIHKISVSLHAVEGNDIEHRLQIYMDSVIDAAKRYSELGVYFVMRLWNLDTNEKSGKKWQEKRLRI